MRLFLLVLTIGAVACTERPVQECEPLVPGVRVVQARVPESTDTIPADAWLELWRVGGRREGQELAIPVSAAASPDGTLAIPDFQLQELVLIGSDGTWLGPKFRRGPGPQEVTYPVAATWSSTGALSVLDLGAPKVIKSISADSVEVAPVSLAFVAPVVSSGELLWAGIQPSGAAYLYPGWKDVAEDDAYLVQGAVLRLRAGASVPDTLVVRTFPGVTEGSFRGTPAPGWARPVVAVAEDGRVAVGGFDESYRILMYDSTGAPEMQICGSGDPLPLTDPERGEFDPEPVPGMSAVIKALPKPPEPAHYGRLLVTADGLLWVQRDRPIPASSSGVLYGAPGALLDVFDQTGAYIRSVRLPERAYLLEARGDAIWTFVIGEYDEVEVVAYSRGKQST